MTLARAWSQRILGAWLVAVLVPGAVLGAVAVAALTGGLGRIGDLGQAFSGPGSVAAGDGTVSRVKHRPGVSRGGGRRPSQRLASAARPRPVATHATTPSGPAAPTAGAPSRGVAGGRTAATVGSGAPGHGGGSSTGRPVPPAHPAPPSPAPASPVPAAPTPPAPTPTLTDRVIGVASGVTNRLPSPAGPAATALLQQAGGAIDKVLPAGR